MIEIKNTDMDPQDDGAFLPHATRRRGGRWRLGGAAIAAIVAAGFWQLSGGSGAADDVIAVEANFGEVVVTDLVEQTSYDGTLGRGSGEAIPATAQGTVTAAAAPGSIVEQGGELYRIDEQPTVLLLGSTPMYRDLRSSDADIAVTARSQGTITWLPEAGAVVEEGDVLYEVDGEPVVALYGLVPAYRTMADESTDLEGDDVLQLEESLDSLGLVSAGEMTVDGIFTAATESVVQQFEELVGATEDGQITLGEVFFVAGPTEIVSIDAGIGEAVTDGRTVVTLQGYEQMSGGDVLQLEVALVDLGFTADGFAADGIFTSETKLALIAFEESVGLDGDGVLSFGEAVFVEQAIRVSDQLVSPGGSVNAGSALLAVTGRDTLVTMQLPAADQGTMEEGASVLVELPDGTEISGTVISVATVATVSADNSTVFEVEVVLDDPNAAAGLDEAPVNVLVISDSVEDVLAIPVSALLALAEGGYAVEVQQGGSIRLVAVDPGFFADGLVEIEADGLNVGDQVVIP